MSRRVYTKKIQVRLRCTICNLEKTHLHYHQVEIESDTPRCKCCISDKEKTITFKGHKSVIDWKICLKCDARFRSYNGKRICDSCKDINKNIF